MLKCSYLQIHRFQHSKSFHEMMLEITLLSSGDAVCLGEFRAVIIRGAIGSSAPILFDAVGVNTHKLFATFNTFTFFLIKQNHASINYRL